MIERQGQSSLITEAKQRGFTSAFAINCTILAKKFPNARYFHFDLNAGSGRNDEVGCIGSPLAFLRTVRDYPLDWRGHFVDIEEKQVAQLLKQPEIDDPRAFVHHGDNAEFCAAIPDLIAEGRRSPNGAMGSVVVDDNGTGIPLQQLATLFNVCPRLDLFLNVTATGLKRSRQFGCPQLSEIRNAIPKQHWLIRQPLGRWQWTMLIGRNIAVGDHAREGFYRLESDRGQSILGRCSETTAMRAAALQPRLL